MVMQHSRSIFIFYAENLKNYEKSNVWQHKLKCSFFNDITKTTNHEKHKNIKKKLMKGLLQKDLCCISILFIFKILLNVLPHVLLDYLKMNQQIVAILMQERLMLVFIPELLITRNISYSSLKLF